MSELTSNQYLIIIAVLVFISIVMLFISRSKRDTQNYNKISIKLSNYNQLMTFRFLKCGQKSN